MIFARFFIIVSTTLILLLSVFLDRLFGEVKHWHPLIGFGKLAARVETAFRSAPINDARIIKLQGVAAVFVLIIPFMFLAHIASCQHYIGPFVNIALLYFSLGSMSLRQHAESVYKALANHDLNQARICVSKIVSRDTNDLNEDSIVSATIESVLENGNDAVFAPIFWFMLFGAPGVVLYRLANTLDAMWGYRNEQYLHFGWAAARLDDLLNWIPARLTAFTYMMLGKQKSAWQCWMAQGNKWYSPNAGPVMAAGAGALEVEVGGPAYYHGQLKERPVLGMGRAPQLKDIKLSINLVDYGLLSWVVIFFILGLFHA